MKEDLEEELEEQSWKKPLRFILALGLALLLIVTIVPFYSVKLDPSPSRIPTIEEVLPGNVEIRNKSVKINSSYDLRQFVTPYDPNVKYVANKVSTLACEGNIICQSKALYYFVRDNLEYVADPQGFEYVESCVEVLGSGGGDCESGSLALASLMEAIGVDAQLVFVANHAYVRIKLEDAPSKYKKDGWIYLDWTCNECSFGEIPWENWEKDHLYLEVP